MTRCLVEGAHWEGAPWPVRLCSSWEELRAGFGGFRAGMPGHGAAMGHPQDGTGGPADREAVVNERSQAGECV